MMTEYCIPGTAGQKITYRGDTYTLAENIHWEDRYPDDAPEESPPIEHCAQILNDNPGEYSEMCWYFMNRAELFKWEAAADWNSNISGIINTYDD